MDIKNIVDTLEEFDGVRVLSYQQSVSSVGQCSGEITVRAPADCDNYLPPILMRIASGVSYNTELTEINVLGRFAVAEHAEGSRTMEITFPLNRMFLFQLKIAREKYLYNKLHKEVDEDIEKWLGER